MTIDFYNLFLKEEAISLKIYFRQSYFNLNIKKVNDFEVIFL